MPGEKFRVAVLATIEESKEKAMAQVPDTYPTAYPQTSPSVRAAYPDTEPATKTAYDWDPGMIRPSASDHRGRAVDAGKRNRPVSNDPYVNYLVNRPATVPPIISRQGVKETLSRRGLEFATGALGYAAGAGAGLGSATGDVAKNMIQSENVGHGVMGAIAGAAIGYGASRMGKKHGGY